MENNNVAAPQNVPADVPVGSSQTPQAVPPTVPVANVPVTTNPPQPVVTPNVAPVAPADQSKMPGLQKINQIPNITSQPVTADVLPPEEKARRTDSGYMADEIEVLSGEVQALESKIDKLVGGMTVTLTTNNPQNNNFKSVSTVKNPLSDVYQSIADKSQETAEEEVQISEDDSAGPVVMISQVLVVVGVILLLILMFLPALKGFLGDNFKVFSNIGWPTALSMLLIGFLIILFKSGYGMFKVLTAVLLLIFTFFYMGIGDMLPESIAGMLSTIFSYYR